MSYLQKLPKFLLEKSLVGILNGKYEKLREEDWRIYELIKNICTLIIS